jgi:hypothetical protein
VAGSKPEIIVDLDAPAGSALKAGGYLSRLKPNRSFHEALDCRHPLGIYNASMLRILKKLTKCCIRLEEYLREAPNLGALHGHEDKQDDLIDYIELCLYAAAEHVDDLELIRRCFFADDASYRKSSDTRKFNATTKPIRDKISGYTNAIKHQQSRIRICSRDFEQAAGSVCLHGFFIEQFHNGGAAPSPIWHSTERVISVTSFLWGVLIYLFSMSEALCEFLVGLDVVETVTDPLPETPLLRTCVIALSRLPLYSFDDEHPFEQIRFIVRAGANSRAELDSNIYGSIVRRWSKSGIASAGMGRMGYEGDGTTAKFEMNPPVNLRIQHWD